MASSTENTHYVVSVLQDRFIIMSDANIVSTVVICPSFLQLPWGDEGCLSPDVCCYYFLFQKNISHQAAYTRTKKKKKKTAPTIGQE